MSGECNICGMAGCVETQHEYTLSSVLCGVLNRVGFITDKFPSEECTVQNTREPEVYDGIEPYLCVLYDPRFDDQMRMQVLYPYICTSEGELYFGWADESGNVFDHKEREINCDDERVVAWMSADSLVNGFEG